MRSGGGALPLGLGLRRLLRSLRQRGHPLDFGLPLALDVALSLGFGRFGSHARRLGFGPRDRSPALGFDRGCALGLTLRGLGRGSRRSGGTLPLGFSLGLRGLLGGLRRRGQVFGFGLPLALDLALSLGFGGFGGHARRLGFGLRDHSPALGNDFGRVLGLTLRGLGRGSRRSDGTLPLGFSLGLRGLLSGLRQRGQMFGFGLRGRSPALGFDLCRVLGLLQRASGGRGLTVRLGQRLALVIGVDLGSAVLGCLAVEFSEPLRRGLPRGPFRRRTGAAPHPPDSDNAQRQRGQQPPQQFVDQCNTPGMWCAEHRPSAATDTMAGT